MSEWKEVVCTDETIMEVRDVSGCSVYRRTKGVVAPRTVNAWRSAGLNVSVHVQAFADDDAEADAAAPVVAAAAEAAVQSIRAAGLDCGDQDWSELDDASEMIEARR